MGSGPGGSGSKAGSLPARVAGTLARDAVLFRGDRVVVALSGGVDSLVLLHLLRFAPELPRLEVVAAHFDHGMREESGTDAHWVRGLCKAWGLTCRLDHATEPLHSEEAAREARYEFLLEVAREVAASRLLTGHHADDQAETVLFRVLRGTGLRGLAGIPRERSPGVYRPLLGVTRGEIQVYASRVGVRPREDRSNELPTFARNLLRHQVFPMVENGVAPGARQSLRRLARLARENEEGWNSLIPSLLQGMLEERKEGFFVVRSALLAYHPAVQSRLLREVFQRAGIRLGEAGTRSALEFTRTGASGKAVALPGGFRLSRDFDQLLLRVDEGSSEERPLAVPDRGEGEGEVVVGGRRFRVRWGAVRPEGCRRLFSAPSSELQFPLRVRGWIPGDRILLPFGRKKLKKLFSEAKIPLGDRSTVPVLVDGRGRVLWVMELATTALVNTISDDVDFFMGILDDPQP